MNKTINEYFVLFKWILSEDATWENELVLQHRGFPLLEDKQFFEGEECNMPSMNYS